VLPLTLNSLGFVFLFAPRLYPFVHERNFPEAKERIEKALGDFEPFEVVLGSMEHFTHGSKSTLFLKPTTQVTDFLFFFIISNFVFIFVFLDSLLICFNDYIAVWRVFFQPATTWDNAHWKDFNHI
jgi:hypothetical protein